MLFHNSKRYLQYCLSEIISFLDKEDLKINPKTRIYKNTDNFIFLGRNKYGKYSKYRLVKRRLKKKYYLYTNNKITLSSFVDTLMCYKNLQ